MSKHSALNTFGRSGNPAFTRNFDLTRGLAREQRMTLDGAVNKTVILLSLCFAGAFIGWQFPALTMPSMIIGAILSFDTIFCKSGKSGHNCSLLRGLSRSRPWGYYPVCRGAVSRHRHPSHRLNLRNISLTAVLL